ncbi:hypothetical protein [Marinobacter sediminum]|uniref:hypothetical protein n=1 Tax=Marinobacter sediminum TaxID=256323 RepID=UPI0035649B8C
MTGISPAIVKAMKSRGLSEKKARDIAFHMTDWLMDFVDLKEFFEAPDKLSTEEVSRLLINFLVHVPAHVAAAAKLATDEPVTDVFGIGAVSEKKAGR